MKGIVVLAACAALAAAAAGGAATRTTELRLPGGTDRGGIFTLRLPGPATIAASTPVRGHKTQLLRFAGASIRVDAPDRMEYGTAGSTQPWQQTPQQAAVYLVHSRTGLKASKQSSTTVVVRDRGGIRFVLAAAEAAEMQTFRFELVRGPAAAMQTLARSARIFLGTVDPRTVATDADAQALMAKARTAMRAARFVTMRELTAMPQEALKEYRRYEIVFATHYRVTFEQGVLTDWAKGTAGFRYDEYGRCWQVFPNFDPSWSPLPTLEPWFADRLEPPKRSGDTIEVRENGYPVNTNAPVSQTWTLDAQSGLPLSVAWTNAFGHSVDTFDWTTPVVDRPAPGKRCP